MSEEVAEQVELGAEDDRLEVSREALDRLLELMGIDVDIEGEEQDEHIAFRITGTEASSLVGKKGKTLDALQFITNKIVSRQFSEHKLVVIDADGYRERRESSLIQLAQRLGDKALDEGKIIKLNPMSARDRRIIHMTLREVEGLETRSEGDGEDRRLLIIPEL